MSVSANTAQDGGAPPPRQTTAMQTWNKETSRK